MRLSEKGQLQGAGDKSVSAEDGLAEVARFVSSLLISFSPLLEFGHQLWSMFFGGKIT